MNGRRRWIYWLLGLFGMFQYAPATETNGQDGTHQHCGGKWTPCAWITWDDWWEVPTYYSPGKFIRVEVCSKCGLLRVPTTSLKKVLTGR